MKEVQNHAERAHALLNASSAHRWLECPPSATAALAYKKETSTFAEEGTLAHEVAEAVLTGGEMPPYAYTLEMVRHAEGYRDYIHELITDDNAVVMAEQRVDFSAWVPEGFGICDCVVLQGSTLTVVDYKYGLGVPVAAEGNPQLRLYALGAYNEFSLAYNIDHVSMHIYQPRLGNVSCETLSVEELLQWADSIKPTAQLAYKGKGKYKAGSHCKFCPHAGRCRALAKACNTVVTNPDLGVNAKVPLLAPFEVAEVLELEPLISLWLKRVKDQALETLLDGGEVPGFKAVAGRSTRDWVDYARVSEVLEDAGYTPADYTETKMMSPAKLEGSIGKKTAAELVGGLVIQKPGSPTIAPASDRREAVTRLAQAQADFE